MFNFFNIFKKKQAQASEPVKEIQVTSFDDAMSKLDTLIDSSTDTVHATSPIITSPDMILMDVKVYYKKNDTFDIFKNVGRIFRLPGVLRLGVYNKDRGFFEDNLITLSEVKRLECNFRTIKRKFNYKKGKRA